MCQRMKSRVSEEVAMPQVWCSKNTVARVICDWRERTDDSDSVSTEKDRAMISASSAFCAARRERGDDEGTRMMAIRCHRCDLSPGISPRHALHHHHHHHSHHKGLRDVSCIMQQWTVSRPHTQTGESVYSIGVHPRAPAQQLTSLFFLLFFFLGTAVSICQSATLFHNISISQQLLDGLPWNLVQTFRLHSG